nr:MAG TPA: hypothetical protein [Caudoviricetes sp.]
MLESCCLTCDGHSCCTVPATAGMTRHPFPHD